MGIQKLLTIGVACLWMGASLAELPDGLLWDDPNAWFEVKGDSIMEDGKPKDLGWRLQYEFRLFGETPEHSAYKIVIGQDGKELGSWRTEGKRSFYGDPARDTHWANLDQGSGNLTAWKQNIVGAGMYDLDIYYIDGASQKEYPARSYKLDVRAAHRVRGAGAQAVEDAPDYYINRHGDAAWSIIVRRPSGFPYYIKSGAGGLPGENTVDVYWNTVPREGKEKGQTVSTQTWIGGRLRVKVDGKPLDLGSEPTQMRVVNDDVRAEYAFHTDRHTEQYHVGAPYKEEIRFATYHAILPLTWRDDDGELTKKQASGSVIYEARPRHNLVALNDHPGRWEAEWIVNGEVIRTWIFVVTADGKIKPWKEAPDHITLHPFASIIEMNIPEGGSSIDGRLAPAFVRDGAFYGLGLPKAFAKKVPEKGKPFPEFSGEYVAAVDPQAERRKQYEEEKAAREAAADAKSAERVAKADARKAEIEAERAARDAKRAADAEAAKLNADAQFEQAKQEALATSEAALAAAAAARESAQEALDEAAQKNRYNHGFPLLVRLLLGIGLMLMGLLLSKTLVLEKVPQSAGVIKALEPMQTLLGYALLALAVLSLLMDLVFLRPLIANGIPQLLAIAGGLIAARGALKEKLAAAGGGAAEQAAKAKDALDKQEARFQALDAQAQNIGLASLVFGLLHLILGGVVLI